MPDVGEAILTVSQVKNAEPKKTRYSIADGRVPGQMLRVQPSGEKSYAIKVRIHGKQVWITIGDADPNVLTLEAARKRGNEIRAMVARGEDPRAAKQEAKRAAADTVEAVARDYILRHAVPNLRSHKQVGYRIDGEIIPFWGKRPIASITKRDVIARLDAIMDRGMPGLANAVHAVGRGLFNWAVGRDIIAASPFYRVKAPAPMVNRERTHSDAELRLIWNAALALGYPWGTFFRLAMLTGQRKSEIRGMRWSEIDPDLTVWSLPPSRVKNKKAHDLPVTALMRHILSSVPRFANSDFVLTTSGQGPVSDVAMAKRMLDAEIARLNGGVPIPPWVIHDFRRSVVSGMAALGVQVVVADKVLNHTGGVLRGVTGTYQRFAFAEEKTQALELWAEHLLTLAGGLPPSETTTVSQKAGVLLDVVMPRKPRTTKKKLKKRLLSADAVQRMQLKPNGLGWRVRDDGAPGLYLAIRNGGRKDWILVRAARNGRWQQTTLGPADTMSPQAARVLALKMTSEFALV